MKILSNLTIEPAFFIMSVSIALEQIATQQMVVLKSCKIDFNYTDEICNNLQSENYTEENAQISAEVRFSIFKILPIKLNYFQLANFNFYGLVIRNVFPAFFAFYLGAWADRFGRKPIFYLFLTATIISQIILVFCAVYFDSRKEWLFLASVPVTLAGGYAAWILAINSFLADISAPEDRAFRYGMLGLAWRAGEPLGSLAGAYLFEAGGFICVFSTTVVGTAFGGLVLVVMIWKYKWNPPKSATKKSAFNISLVLDAFKATFRKRKGPNRKYIMVLIAVSMFTLVPFYGEFAVIGYAYVFTRYKWEVKEFARYSTIMGTIDIVAQAIFIPLIRIFNLNEAWVMSFLFFTITTRHMVKAFAYDPWMYYLGSIIDCLGYYAVTINRAMTSLCVSQHDLGKLMAFYSALESLAPIGVGFIYSTVWNVSYNFNLYLYLTLHITFFS